MLRCTRKGCGLEYADGEVNLCTYHPGSPVFHEGLKSWSCCQDINKPVLDFDEFMKIEGCTEIEGHTTETPVAPAAQPKPAATVSTLKTPDGTEIFQLDALRANIPAASLRVEESAAAPILELEDLNRPVEVGTACRRKGCQTTFVSDEVNRHGDGEGTVCRYHPLPPLFREGSKGYLCCKRKVLEFEEFLKIEGCQIGRHCFVPVAADPKTEELVECRVDHYQTPEQVHVSVFAKKVEKDRSTVKFENTKVVLELFLPGQKRFSRTLDLFGDIDADRSTFQFFGTKVELHLQKKDTRVWTVLEKTTQDLGNISLTFGVGGRTGTVGGKEIILDESNKLRT
ncbi:hypothetical protein GALMADRAFT_239443 [Galerina marginata CBS 339.88]|uniref:CS domain-containing protein n=1 Tax=Galerina marginata (strain CBS 339.88) TaxID=685588 RepID=A0A067TRB2_GALM3|nr:hypothetical protein GALMADRAFT_239443 [Galerina marginata CBS 339.88]